MEWIVPILAIAIGIAIVVYLLIPKRQRGQKAGASKAPLCPGCTAGSCAAMGDGEIDIEAIRHKLIERGEKPAERASSK